MTRHNQSSKASFLGFPIDLILVALSILAVGIATLYPFNFSIPENFSPSALLNRFDNTSFFKDHPSSSTIAISGNAIIVVAAKATTTPPGANSDLCR